MPARIGNFTGPVFAFGQVLNIVHPTDNSFLEAQFFPEVLAEEGLTADERAELQREIEELVAVMELGRDFYT